MGLTKEERVLRIINRQEVDYLPSQITLADRTRDEELSRALGLSGYSELDDYLENHLFLTLTLQDKPLFFRDVKDEINKLHDLGYANPDWENNVVYDNWGMGIKVGAGSFFCSFHPLQGKTTEHIAKFMPKHLSRNSYMSTNVEEAVKNWQAPDINMPGNFDEWESDLKNYSGQFLVWPSGYFGIYERSYAVMGWNEFMLNIAGSPKVVEELLDKVTDYKVQHAKKMVEMGFKIAHHGDDFGTQCGSFFSKDMFRKYIYPRLKREWDVFTDAGLPIMLHSCGNIIDFIPDLIDIGLKILEPVQPCMDLEFLKREYGKDLIFFGGINTQILPYITPEETKELTKNAIRILGKGGGMIIAPSQEIMNDVPIENIKALVETIREEREKVLSL
ncbi:MAG: uroporphyrinogen decarboxylase family protein [Candidatus Humimicrobiaceae bacterium]